MKRFDQINMIPFIDIMLVLLAIVLTTATFVSQGLIAINLPSAQHTTTTPSSPPLQIAVNAKHQLFIDEVSVSFDQLAQHLNTLPNTQTIVLRIDKDVAFEQFVKLIDLLKARSFNNISIQIQQAK